MAPLRSVLLVDDSTSDNLINTLWLQRAGAVESRESIVVRENGKAALDYLLEQAAAARQGTGVLPALILLDINMPVMTGFELLDALEQHAAQIDLDSVVILMLTSSCAEQDRQRAAAYRAVRGYIEKPMTREIVQRILAEHFS